MRGNDPHQSTKGILAYISKAINFLICHSRSPQVDASQHFSLDHYSLKPMSKHIPKVHSSLANEITDPKSPFINISNKSKNQTFKFSDKARIYASIAKPTPISFGKGLIYILLSSKRRPPIPV